MLPIVLPSSLQQLQQLERQTTLAEQKIGQGFEMVAPFSLTCHSLFVERRAAAARNLTSLAGRLTPLSCPPTSQGGVPRWLLRRRDLCKYSRLFLLAEADTRLSPGDKNVICSAAPLPSPRRLGLAPPCQETQQQNLKPPQLLPSCDLRLWQRGRS